jgi:hypothetical protein
LVCETEPEKVGLAGVTVLECRKLAFFMIQFFHRHQKDFVPDPKNVGLLADAMDKIAPADISLWTVETLEEVFRQVDKNKLDKKVYVGEGKDRRPW